MVGSNGIQTGIIQFPYAEKGVVAKLDVAGALADLHELMQMIQEGIQRTDQHNENKQLAFKNNAKKPVSDPVNINQLNIITGPNPIGDNR